ncbi:MAG: hypothetical protein LIO87_03290, partial [Eubacterium sp.]|nr:hypothetical protein [Eubacterium sp.]
MTSYIIITAIFMLLILVEFGIENNSYSTSTVVKCGNFTFSSQGFFVFIFIAICIFLMSMRGINVGYDTYDYYITFEKAAKYGVESVSRIE